MKTEIYSSIIREALRLNNANFLFEMDFKYVWSTQMMHRTNYGDFSDGYQLEPLLKWHVLIEFLHGVWLWKGGQLIVSPCNSIFKANELIHGFLINTFFKAIYHRIAKFEFKRYLMFSSLKFVFIKFDM